MQTLFTVVNESQQKEILKLLSDFEIKPLSDDFRFPLVIRFDEKTIDRTTSITVCAGLSACGRIIRDYGKTKTIIGQYLQEQEQA